MPHGQTHPGRLQLIGLLIALTLLAACGAAPQTPGGAAPTAGATEGGAPTAPVAASTAYPAPEGAASGPTAYPAPLGGAAEQPTATATAPLAVTTVPAPTRAPEVVTAAPDAGQGIAPTLQPGVNLGEVPSDKAALAIADLVQRTGAAASAVSVVSGEFVEWPDGALGCPQPGMMYPQVITPGYKLVLSVNGQEYNYHASEQGDFFLCENTGPRVRP